MAKFIKPGLLKPGDKIVIIAPSGVVEADYINKSIKLFESWGLKVDKGKHLFSSYHQFAGRDNERLSDLQNALDSEEYKAVICARGGYGAIRIIDQINWNKFIENPKWVIGFSDISVIHFSVQNLGIQSIHGVMPINMAKLDAMSDPVKLLGQALFEGSLEYNLSPDSINSPGTEIAPVVGGNLSLLYALAATPKAPNLENKILFIEDVGEHYYHIDRMIQSLRLSGILDKLCGLIVGGLTEMADNKRPFGMEPLEIIHEAIKEYDYPVLFKFPAGHQQENNPVILGAQTAMEVTPKMVKVRFE